MPAHEALSLSHRKIIISQCEGVAEEVVEDFLGRMDPDYFSSFTSDAIARHISLGIPIWEGARLPLRRDNACKEHTPHHGVMPVQAGIQITYGWERASRRARASSLVPRTGLSH